MKSCPQCGASNADFARFCNECGKQFELSSSAEAVQASRAESSSDDDRTRRSEKLLERVKTLEAKLEAKRRADVMFVLDCTGSMRGEIDAIRDAILDFADTIAKDGVRSRIGLVEFRDRLEGEEHRVLQFNGSVFTDDPALFRQEVTKLVATGGGSTPESSMDALMLALRQPFDAASTKVIVLITDAPPHLPDKETQNIEEVLDELKRVGVTQVYPVIPVAEKDCQIYLRLLEGRRGLAFELGKGGDFRARAENFKRTLMSLGKTISGTL